MQFKTYRHAITRTPPDSMAQGITSQNSLPDILLAREQHQHYVNALKKLNIDVTVLPPEEDFPDSHFVEDAAIIYNNTAILTRPGAKERRGEVEKLKPILENFFTLYDLGDDEATLDGGDVLFVGKHVLIGLSHRTNETGAKRLGEILKKIDDSLHIHLIHFTGALHLKSGLTALGPDLLLGDPAIKFSTPLPIKNIVWLPADEGFAANILNVNGAAFLFKQSEAAYQAAHQAGLTPIALDFSEFRKMDGSFTCLSLLW